MGQERLDKILANLGYNSRKGAGIMIKQGRVRVGGEIIKNPAHKFNPSEEKCLIDDHEIDPLPPLTVAFNKPPGLICDREGLYPTVFEYLPHRWQIRTPGFSCAGRLDKDSRGLVILSEDGQLVHKLISPNVPTDKIYAVTLSIPLQSEDIGTLEKGGMKLDSKSKPLRPATIRTIGECQYEITLREGQHRQIRRMVEKFGPEVIDLQRIAIGKLSLQDIELEEEAFQRIDPEKII